MNILFADPDRDLLRSYSQLLAGRGHTVATAFEGTEALRLLREGGQDLLLIDLGLPRLDPGRLIREAREKKLPALVLTDRPLNAPLLLEGPPAAAWLSYPFLPGELYDLAEDTARKAVSGEHFQCGDADVDVSAFSLEDGVPLCGREIDLLRNLAAEEEDKDKGGSGGESGNESESKGKSGGTGEKIRNLFVRTSETAVCVQALNRKLSRLGKKTRIQYYPQKGYGLVVNGNG